MRNSDANIIYLNSGINWTEKQLEAKRLMVNSKYFLAAGGSRSGKTFVLCDAVVTRAVKKKSRHAILRFHFSDVKTSVGMDTLPKILDLLEIPYELNKSDWVFTLPNGSEIWLGGLDDKERVEKILGREYSTIYINEASQVSYHAYQTALTRLAENSGLTPRVFIDCNPPEKSHWLFALFILGKDPLNRNLPIPNPGNYSYLNINPVDNISNLPKGYIEETLEGLDERSKARFRDGIWLDKRHGSLWSYDLIASSRVDRAPSLRRIVVAIDPAVTSNQDSDETGIVVAGISDGVDGDVYILSDSSLVGTPHEWASKAIEAYRKYNADRIVAEINQGGDLVESVLRTIDRTVPYRQVRATRGKLLRAEPVAALYEKSKVHHVGTFRELETQMCEWTPDAQKSPDRLDALVWAVTELTSKKPIYQSPIVV